VPGYLLVGTDDHGHVQRNAGNWAAAKAAGEEGWQRLFLESLFSPMDVQKSWAQILALPPAG
jgi:hypothetical protein